MGMLGQALGILLRRPKLLLLGALPAVLTTLLLLGGMIALVVWIGDLAPWATPFADTWSETWQTTIRIVVCQVSDQVSAKGVAHGARSPIHTTRAIIPPSSNRVVRTAGRAPRSNSFGLRSRMPSA